MAVCISAARVERSTESPEGSCALDTWRTVFGRTPCMPFMRILLSILIAATLLLRPSHCLSRFRSAARQLVTQQLPEAESTPVRDLPGHLLIQHLLERLHTAAGAHKPGFRNGSPHG